MILWLSVEWEVFVDEAGLGPLAGLLGEVVGLGELPGAGGAAGRQVCEAAVGADGAPGLGVLVVVTGGYLTSKSALAPSRDVWEARRLGRALGCLCSSAKPTSA